MRWRWASLPRAVVAAWLADQWEPVTTREVADVAGVPTKRARQLLEALEGAGLAVQVGPLRSGRSPRSVLWVAA